MRGREAVALSVVHGGVNKHELSRDDMIANDKEYFDNDGYCISSNIL
jgi:hypothetical protein